MILIDYICHNLENKHCRLISNILNKKYIKEELIFSNNLLSNINGYSLDKEQRIAIITDENANLIIAGAGSGKTLTMIGKIRYLIERKNIKEDEILCITFTRDASLNLEKSIKKNYNYNIKVYTFHSLALQFLKDYNYNIIENDTLNYIVNEYFYSIIKLNKEMVKKLRRVLGKIDVPYENILKSNDLKMLKKLIITFINLFKTNDFKLDFFLKIKDNKDLVSIIIDIYILYEQELKSTNSIDFNDMINLSRKFISTNNIKMYKYIIVDEYQDTSYIRYLFLKEIIKKTNAKIVCVGDDYQSIYRFNGCNLNTFLNFKKHFGFSKVLKITNTYRNSQELINVAGNFIMKNKKQLYKKLRSNKSIKKPIKIKYGNNLYNLLDLVLKRYENILILGRNKFDIIKYFNPNKEGYINYNNTKIRYLTIHKSKGLEEDCVIIINLKDDVLGMPNKLKDDKILKYVNNNIDLYPFEEERRLFYVALTRTKGEVYLLVDKNKPSIFVKELIKDYNLYIEYI